MIEATVELGRDAMKATQWEACGLAMLFVVGFMGACSHPETRAGNGWNQKNAAAYLDQREAWWMAWPVAARDHQTFCVSCHTAVSYALARPALRTALGEDVPSPGERRLLDNVAKRVRLWNEVKPYYSDKEYGEHKAAQSRGTEAVLNALILATYDAREGKLSDDTRAAFADMWALQQTQGDGKGAWSWLQFNNEPWEAHDSQYYGAALAAVATGAAPDNYRSSPEIQNNLKLLREYLNREYTEQSAINRVVLLWASTKWPGLLTRERRQSIVSEVIDQQRADGSWSLAPLSWTWRDWSLKSQIKLWIRSDATPLEPKSDGYATGLIVFALEQASLPRENVHLERGLAWLMRSQNKKEGFWPSYSLNGRHDPSSDTGRFMDDAATAYAVLALTDNGTR
ncbi:MAG: hypothetical protein ACRD19_10075 [Terriglobia bacterium]